MHKKIVPSRDLGREPPACAGEIPCGHNVLLIQRLWSAQQTLEHGWSRAVLTHQIDSGLYKRQGKAVTNFERTEYALHDLTRPLRVATYRLLPEEIRRQLPSPEELRRGLLLGGGPASE
jgi:predicted nuclease of restriction endonuclease-like (RecB) superfamily